MHVTHEFLVEAVKTTEGVVKVLIPADMMGQLPAVEGVIVETHASHLFLFLDAAGEVIAAHNLPRC
jgi:hypothetical protein